MTQCSTTGTINPLDFPEIRLVLADFLSPHSLTVCARVSKDWNTSFMLPLWRRISLRVGVDKASHPLNRVTTLELAIKHSEFIQSVTIQDLNEWRVRQRKELWSAIPDFPILRSLVLQQTNVLQIKIKPESIQQLKPRFTSLNCLDFHPFITLESESYEEILSGCPQLHTLRGGTVKAKVLAEGRPWVCTMLRDWSLCLDFGSTDDYRGKLSSAAKEASDSEDPSSLEKDMGLQVEQMRKEVRRQLYERMSLLVKLECVDFRRKHQNNLSYCLRMDHDDSGLELLLQCPRLKEIHYDWDESELETYDWIKTHWQEIEVNSFPDSEDEYEFEDEDEDDEDFHGFGFGSRGYYCYSHDSCDSDGYYDSEFDDYHDLW